MFNSLDYYYNYQAKMYLLFGGLILLQLLSLASSQNIRVTCIGDSITEGGSCGVGSYVDKLQSILGDHYSVYNAGASGMTMLKKGQCDNSMNSSCSYWDTEAWSQAQESYPDIVTIMLGTNDAKAFNWETIQQSTGDYYALDYVELVQKVQAFKSNPKIYVMVPPPLRSPYPYLMNATVINEIFPTLVRNIASVKNVEIIDIFDALSGADYSCDGCHPSEDGSQLIAETIANVIVPK